MGRRVVPDIVFDPGHPPVGSPGTRGNVGENVNGIFPFITIVILKERIQR